jgi:hypothetical protein
VIADNFIKDHQCGVELALQRETIPFFVEDFRAARTVGIRLQTSVKEMDGLRITAGLGGGSARPEQGSFRMFWFFRARRGFVEPHGGYLKGPAIVMKLRHPKKHLGCGFTIREVFQELIADEECLRFTPEQIKAPPLHKERPLRSGRPGMKPGNLLEIAECGGHIAHPVAHNSAVQQRVCLYGAQIVPSEELIQHSERLPPLTTLFMDIRGL